MNHILGICIPTYRRPEQLQKCLATVIASARPYDVPIFVTDDSCDETNHGVRAWSQKVYAHIRWFLNPVNRGIDGNILHATDVCTSEYAWLLGEDDRMLPDGVAAVLAFLNEQPVPVPFVYVNYAAVDCNIRTILRRQAVPLQADQTLGFVEFASTYVWAAGFIGGCVVCKQNWQRVRTERYTGTYFAHVGHILEMIVGQNVPLLAEALVLNRCGEPRLFSWTSSFFDVLQGWSRMTALLPDPPYHADLQRQAVEAFETSQGLRTIKFLLYARADYAYNRKMFVRYILPHNPKGVYRLGALAVLWMPPFLIRMGRSVLAFVRRHRLPAVDPDHRLADL